MCIRDRIQRDSDTRQRIKLHLKSEEVVEDKCHRYIYSQAGNYQKKICLLYTSSTTSKITVQITYFTIQTVAKYNFYSTIKKARIKNINLVLFTTIPTCYVIHEYRQSTMESTDYLQHWH